MFKKSIYNYNEAPSGQETSEKMTAAQMAVVLYDDLWVRAAKRVKSAEGDSDEENVVFQELMGIVKEVGIILQHEEIQDSPQESKVLKKMLGCNGYRVGGCVCLCAEFLGSRQKAEGRGLSQMRWLGRNST